MSARKRLILGFGPLVAAAVGAAVGLLLFGSAEAGVFGAGIGLLVTFPASLLEQATHEPREQRPSRASRWMLGVGLPIGLMSPLLALFARDFPLGLRAVFAVVGFGLAFAGVYAGRQVRDDAGKRT